jgi:hypothetical protein
MAAFTAPYSVTLRRQSVRALALTWRFAHRVALRSRSAPIMTRVFQNFLPNNPGLFLEWFRM